MLYCPRCAQLVYSSSSICPHCGCTTLYSMHVGGGMGPSWMASGGYVNVSSPVTMDFELIDYQLMAAILASEDECLVYTQVEYDAAKRHRLVKTEIDGKIILTVEER